MQVILLGEMGDRFGSEFDLECRSIAEAVRALCCLLNGFQQYLNSGGNFDVIASPCSGNDDEYLNQQIDRVTISPTIHGSGAVGRILTGTALLGVSFFMPAAFMGVSSMTIGQMGVAMIAGGIVELLTPTDSSKDSFMADGGGLDRTVQGSPVPVLFGERFVKPKVISLAVDNNNIAVDFNSNA